MKMFKKKPLKTISNIQIFNITYNSSIRSHKKVKGSMIGNLEKVSFSLPFWESNYYKIKIMKYIETIDKKSKVLDVGCGDGRFTLLLIKMGFSNIVCVDSNLESLMKLQDNLKKIGKTNKCTLVLSSVLDLPFSKNYFDLVLSIGVLYYLNKDYEIALKNVVNCTKSKGLIIETEPDKEGNAIKAMMFDGIKGYLDVVENNRFIEYFNNRPLKLRCFDEEELKKIFYKYNLIIVSNESISLFPSLLTIGKKKKLIEGIDHSFNKIKKIRKSFDYFSNKNGIAKHKLWVLTKH